jgi:hypothetical protein
MPCLGRHDLLELLLRDRGTPFYHRGPDAAIRFAAAAWEQE